MIGKGKWVGDSRSLGWAAALFAVLGACGGSDSVESIAQTSQALTTNERILGFEQPLVDWSAQSATRSDSTTASQGSHSLGLFLPSNVEAVATSTVSSLGQVGDNVSFDLRLPVAQPTGWTYAQITLASSTLQLWYVDLGRIDLAGKPAGSFQRISFPLSSTLRSQLSGTYSDLQIQVHINAVGNAQPYLVDNLDFHVPGATGTGGGSSGGSGGTAGTGGTTGGTATGGTTTGGTGNTAGTGGTGGTGGTSGTGGSAGSDSTVTFSFKLPSGVDRREVVLATTGASLFVDDRVRVLESDTGFASISSVGGGNVARVGVEAEVNDVWSGGTGTVALENRTHVHGTVTTAATITSQPDTIIDGPVFEHADLNPLETVSWTVTFPAATQGPVSVGNNTMQTKLPGAYGAATVYQGGKLILDGPGVYTFDSIDLEPGSTLEVHNSGAVFIYSKTFLIFRGTITRSVDRPNVLVGVAGSSTVTIETPFRGVLVAPSSTISLATVTTSHRGSFWGEGMIVHQDSAIIHEPFDPAEFCPPDAACSSFCPCVPGKGTCTSDADCSQGLTCPTAPNGPRHGLGRTARVCEAPICAVDPRAGGCGTATSPCGINCDNVVPCSGNADCPNGEVCGIGKGSLYGSVIADVCVPAGCLSDPVVTGCGIGAICGRCPCTTTCASKHCGDNAFDGCTGVCTGLCADRQSGCTADSDCPVGDACIIGGGPRLGLSATTNVCLPEICRDPNPERQPCSATDVTATCGLCPVSTEACLFDDTGARMDCGIDHGVNCGNCGSTQSCVGGVCVSRTYSDETLTLTGTARTPDQEQFSISPLQSSAVELSVVPGATSGDFDVTDRGAAAYKIPIAVPPGRAGMEPDLSLDYTGTSPNGLVGVGWTIGGLSSISRCPKISASDGWAVPVQYDSSDRLCMDGRRLMLVSGTYGATGAVYRTEIDTFSKIIQHGDLVGEQSFEVFRKDGRIFTYGGRRDARLYVDSNQHVIRAWALSEIRDHVGNTIVYRYESFPRYFNPVNLPTLVTDSETAEFWPKEITYGSFASSAGEVTPSRSILFEYGQDRPDYMDGHTPGGGAVVRTRLLKRITTSYLNMPIRSYVLEHADAPSGGQGGTLRGVQRLKQVTECAEKLNRTVCKRPTVFEYTDQRGLVRDGSGQAVTNVSAHGGGNSHAQPMIVLDWNGDGRKDLLVASGAPDEPSWTLLVATGSRSGEPFTQINPGFTHASSRDVFDRVDCFSQNSVFDSDLDGKDDLLDTCRQDVGGGLTNAYRVWKGTGDPSHPFSAARITPIFSADFHAQMLARPFLADLNGDGIKDLFECVGKRNTFQVSALLAPYIETGRAYLLDEHLNADDPRGDIPTPCTFAPNTSFSPAFMVADIDGDGHEDVLTEAKDVLNGTLQLRRYVPDPNHEPTAEWRPVFLSPDTASTAFHDGLYRFVDVNGDGLKDLIWMGSNELPRLAMNWGGPLNYPVSGPLYTDDPPIGTTTLLGADLIRYALAVDYNGDGLEDLIRPTPRDLHIRGPSGFVQWLFEQGKSGNDEGGRQPGLLSDPFGSVTLTQFQPQPNVEIAPDETQNSPVALADVDGDGSADLIMQSAEYGHIVVSYGQFGRENLLKSVTDGIGKRIEIRYDSKQTFADSIEHPTYTPATVCRTNPSSTDASTRCLGPTGPVVSQYAVEFKRANGSFTPDRTVRVRYEDAREGLFGRGWLGFGKRISETSRSSGQLVQRTEVTFDNKTLYSNLLLDASKLFPFAGLETQRVETTKSAKSDLEKEFAANVTTRSNRWRVEGSFHNGLFPTLDVTTETIEDIGVSGTHYPVKTISSAYEPDAFGNTVLAVVTTISQGQSVNQLTTETLYDSSAERIDSWLVSLPKRTTVTDKVFRGPNEQVSKTRTTGFVFDEDGLPKTVTREPDERDDSNLKQVVTFERDADLFHSLAGIRVTGNWHDGDQVVPGERHTTFLYDTDKIFPAQVQLHVGTGMLLTDVKYDPRFGTLIARVDPTGIGEQWAYDSFGRITDHVTAAETVTTTYQDPIRTANGLFEVDAQIESTTTSSTGAANTSRYDSFGRVVQTQTKGLKGKNVFQDLFYEFGSLVSTAARPHLAADNSQGFVTNTYDPRLRLQKRTFPDGSHVDYLRAAVGNLVPGVVSGAEFGEIGAEGVVDPLGHRTVTLSDHRGSPLRSVDALGNQSRYQYDPFETLHKITDLGAGFNVTTIETDRLGRRTSHSDNDTGTSTTGYTSFDQPFFHRDGAGRTTHFDYDDIGRLKALEASTDASPTVFAYDGPASQNALGRLVEMTSPTGEVERYHYEPANPSDPMHNRGFVQNIERLIAGDTFITKFTYDPDTSQLDHVEYPASAAHHTDTPASADRFVVNYDYDVAGNLVRVTNVDTDTGTPSNMYWRLDTDEQGIRIKQESFADTNIETNYTYDQLNGRLQALVTRNITDATALQDIRYSQYDLVGNLRTRTEAFQKHGQPTAAPDTFNSAFTYDELNRLRTATDNDALTTVDPDELGNIRRKSDVGTYLYNVTGEKYRPHAVQVISDGTNTLSRFRYDDAGNMIHREGQGVRGGTQDIEYTSFNLPSRVTGGDGTDIQYHYDAAHRRVSMTLGTGEQRIYAGSAYERQTTEDAAGAVTRHEYKVFAGSRQIAQVERETRSGVTVETARRFLHADRMGSSQVITDEQGRLVHVQRFDPWGKALTPASGSSDVAAQNIRAGFTGHETDVETGLVNMRGRIYDPRLGRFMQADPILQSPFWSQGLNRYSYALNNPFMYIDPSGFENDPDEIPDPSDNDPDSVTYEGTDEKTGLPTYSTTISPAADDVGTADAPDVVSVDPISADQSSSESDMSSDAPEAVESQLDDELSDVGIDSWGEGAQAGPDADRNDPAPLSGVSLTQALGPNTPPGYNPFLPLVGQMPLDPSPFGPSGPNTPQNFNPFVPLAGQGWQPALPRGSGSPGGAVEGFYGVQATAAAPGGALSGGVFHTNGRPELGAPPVQNVATVSPTTASMGFSLSLAVTIGGCQGGLQAMPSQDSVSVGALIGTGTLYLDPETSQVTGWSMGIGPSLGFDYSVVATPGEASSNAFF